MAKKTTLEKNARRRRLVEQYAKKRAELKSKALDESLSIEERFDARVKLAKLPRTSTPVRIRDARTAIIGGVRIKIAPTGQQTLKAKRIRTAVRAFYD